jgi:hypothetical protein
MSAKPIHEAALDILADSRIADLDALPAAV